MIKIKSKYLDQPEFLKAFTSKKETLKYVKRYRGLYKFVEYYIVTEKLLWKSKGAKDV